MSWASLRWLVAAGGSVALVAAAGLLFRPAGPAIEKPRFGPILGVQIVPAMAETALLTDPTPLFLPTPLSSESHRAAGRDLEQKFAAEPPQFAFREGDLQLELKLPMATPANPAEALVQNPPGNPVLGIGRSDGQVPVLPARRAFVQAVNLGDGKVVLRSSLPDDGGGAGWSPIDFMAKVGPAGLIGRLEPAAPRGAGAQFPALDSDRMARLEKVLEQELFLHHEWSPGAYRITVGP